MSPETLARKLLTIADRKSHGFFLRRRELSALGQMDAKAYGPIERAISGVMEDNLAPVEKEKIAEIESLRASLCSSDSVISVVDYGAGKKDSVQRDSGSRGGTVVESTIGEVCRRASKKGKWVTLLYRLIRESKPKKCLELGTCLGISSAYQAAALEMNGKGRLITIEGDETLAEIATENLRKLGLEEFVDVEAGRFQDTLGGTLEKHSPLEYAFIDGHHEKEATIRYFNAIMPYLSENALVVFDDIRWSAGMQKAWKEISSDDRIRLSVDLYSMGLCMKGAGKKSKIRISID